MLRNGQENGGCHATLRFGQANQTELFRTLLRNRSRQPGETVSELAHDTQRLLSRAYPHASVEMKETLAREFFIDAVGDSDFRWKIYQARPKTFNEAVSIAVELEAFALSEQKRGNIKRVRAVGERTGSVKEDEKLALSRKRLWSVGSNSLYVTGKLEGVRVNFLVDTGAEVTVIQTGVFRRLTTGKALRLDEVPLDLAAADGRPLTFLGRGNLLLKVGELEVEHEVLVADIDADALLGYDFLKLYNCTIDAGAGKLTIGKRQLEQLGTDVDKSVGTRVVVANTVVVPASSEKVVMARTSAQMEMSACAIVECSESFLRRRQLMVARALVDPSKGVIPLRLMNVTDRPVTLYEGTSVGQCQPVELVDSIASERAKCRTVTKGERSGAKGIIALGEHLEILAEKSCVDLSKEEADRVRQLLADNANVFARSKEDLGRTDLVKHEIDTGTAKPIRQAPRRLTIHKKAEADKELDKMLRQGVIEPSNSAWSSPVVLVKKKDGSLRYCIDYRKLNNVTEKDSYPLPRIDDSLDTLAGSKWFLTLDLASGYWQVEVAEQDRHKTAFVTNRGLFQFKVLPFGLCNAPATFERLMERF
ncbi:Retrovirus-related Pol polyprotein from transposon [Apostichopus japonicus]|uniref:Retrovirus-related Pol polyprotein from transposon n=1 Tax=Stichopus japonicus TaxID=307972 RepID=A0A2G8K9V5_STIJA|nr:Retrovirus-related Pol polyprotein from transposon [Apostichopus japonicus]